LLCSVFTRSLFRNDQWVIIAIVTFVLLISVAMKGGVTPNYVSNYLNSESSITLFMTSVMLMGVAGALFANWMTSRYCKVMVMQWASVALILSKPKPRLVESCSCTPGPRQLLA
jgi:GPH family glycoside/pentoside/hexuronide:cation symporter